MSAQAAYVLTKPCLACNREAGWPACSLCSRIEYAERSVTGRESAELRPVPPPVDPRKSHSLAR